MNDYQAANLLLVLERIAKALENGLVQSSEMHAQYMAIQTSHKDNRALFEEHMKWHRNRDFRPGLEQ